MKRDEKYDAILRDAHAFSLVALKVTDSFAEALDPTEEGADPLVGLVAGLMASATHSLGLIAEMTSHRCPIAPKPEPKEPPSDAH